MANTLQGYQNSAAAKQAAGYQNMTMEQVAKKYGFNISHGYAEQQANTEANAQKIAQNAASRENNSSNQLTLQKILDGYRDSAKSLDSGYFKQFLGTRQDQVNRGLTGGIAAAQNVQLAMNKQSELGGLWRTRNQATAEEMSRFNNTKQQIADALSQIEKERVLNTEKYYQNGLDRGYNVLSSDRNYGLQLDSNGWQKYLAGAQFDQQLRAYADAQKQAAAAAAAARAAASRRSYSSGGGSGSGGTSVKKTSLSTAYNGYSAKKASQAKTNIEKYYTSPAVVAGQRTGSPYFKNPVAPAQNPNLSAWEKMKLLGL